MSLVVGKVKLMKTTIGVLTLLLVFTTSCRKGDVTITQIKVWDENFQVVTTVTDAETLASIAKIWEDKTTVDESPIFSHKIDVATPEGSTRWLYHPDGYARILSVKANTPTCRVREPEKLNGIIIPQQNLEGDSDNRARFH